MDLFRVLFQTVLLIVCLGSCAAQCVALQAAGTEQIKFERLTLDLATTKEQYRLLEPIPILLTLANRTEHVINGHSALDFGYNYVELYVGPGQGEMKNIGPLSMVSIYLAAKRRAMKPGAEFSAKELLNLRLDQIFPEPGTYLIEARVFDLDRKESVISKPLAVRVLPATGVDHQALEFIKTYGDPSYFLTGTRMDRNLHFMETVASTFGESAYGDYATFNIALHSFATRDYEKAQKHFEKLAKKRDFVFSDKAADYIEKIKKLKEPEP